MPLSSSARFALLCIGALPGCLGSYTALPVEDLAALAGPADLATPPPPPADLATPPPPADITLEKIVLENMPDLAVEVVSGKTRFEQQVKPLLEARCTVCHGKDGGLGPALLKAPIYDILLAWPRIITRDPTHSLLVTKGPHSGAAWFGPPEVLVVLDWLAIEAKALPKSLSQSVSAPPITPKNGANTIPLGALGKEFLGAELTFEASFLAATMKATDVTIRATGSTGIHLVHPLFFVIHNGVKTPDPVDNFEAVDLTVANAKTAPIGAGLFFLPNIVQNDQVAVAFLKFEVSGPPPVPMGGCKAADLFTLHARPTLSQRCVMCHGGTNDTARNALDMSKMDDLTPNGQAIACAQMKNRINPDDPAKSQILISPNPKAMTNHMYRFPDQTSFDTFAKSATMWIEKEK